MDSEEIFEAVGEVVTELEVEANTTLRSLFDESNEVYPCETPSTMQSLLQSGMNDEGVITYIFESCDESKTGYVQASTLVEFLSNACGNNNLQEIFQQLLSILDPDDLNPDIDIETFQEALKCWITSITTKEFKSSDQELLNSPPKKTNINFNKKTPSKNNNSISECLSTSSSSSSGEVDLKELQYKFAKLQEENKELKFQMADVEEVVTTLRTENSQLKSVINRVEQEATDITAKSLHLQEDNGALQNRLEDLKEELRRMTEAYNECQNDLKKKTHELNILEINSSKEEHQCEHLSETIRQLEEVLLNKEKELRAKDEEIHRIAEALIEQQVLSAQRPKNEEDKPVLGTETLASELHSSVGTPWKRQLMESIVKPDSIHQAAWSAMLSEPEFEDAPKNSRDQEQASVLKTPKKTDDKVDPSSASKVSPFSELNAQPQAVEELSVAYNGVAHSTPFKLKSFNFDTATCEKAWNNDHLSTTISPLPLFLKRIYAICYIGLAFLAFLGLTIIAIFFLSSSASCGSGCEGVSHYPQQASSLYRTSLWPNLISILTPYCRIEYSGSPPV